MDFKSFYHLDNLQKIKKELELYNPGSIFPGVVGAICLILGFYALQTLPKTIAKLQREAAALQQKLDDPDFYTRDRAGFEKVTTALGDIQHKIAAAEEQWLELEILREELAGGS